MFLEKPQGALASLLTPLAVDEFLNRTLTGGFRVLKADGRLERTELLGPDPGATLAGALHLADQLTWHSANATGPAPSLDGIAGPDDFRSRIAAFHARNYSVRFPGLRPLSKPLERVAHELETRLHAPVSASAFWSRGGMRAPVHYDDHDLIVIQLMGRKRWYVSSRPSALNNAWKGADGDPPDLGPHEVIDLAPGDLIYLPRGTFHTVDSDAESIHVALGFTPLTVREAVLAALDHLSDLDRDLRTTIGSRKLSAVGPRALQAAARLAEACRRPEFMSAALQRRSARTIAALDALPRPTSPPQITRDSQLVHADGALSHLTGTSEVIDFAYPGGHLYINRGAEAAVVFMADTPRFRVGEVPGVGEDVAVALATRLAEVGFLRIAD